MPVKVGVSGVVKSVSSIPIAVNGVIKNTTYGYVGINGAVTRFFPYAKRPTKLVIRPYAVSKAVVTDSNANITYTGTTLSAQTSLGTLTSTSNYLQTTIYSGSANLSSGLIVYYRAYVVWDDGTETEMRSFIQNGGTISITISFANSVSSSSYTYYRYWHYFYGGNSSSASGTYTYTQTDLTGTNGTIGGSHDYNYSTGTIYTTHTFSNCTLNGVSVSVVCENTTLT